jgi:hypothetical protein
VTSLAVVALAAGELICQFGDEALLLYAVRTETAGVVLDSRRPGGRAVLVREQSDRLHFIEREGPTVRVTTLTSCTRAKADRCTRFSAQTAWHFDTRAPLEPEASFRRQPSGAASGSCEPWRVD